MSATIEVRVAGRGTVVDGEATLDEATEASCELCGESVELVVSAGPEGAPFACKDCLRGRLEATTVAQWLLRDPSARGLPWGKISG